RRPDRVLVHERLPAVEVRVLPVAVGPPHVGNTVVRDLCEDHVDLGRRRIAGVDQQGDTFFVLRHRRAPRGLTRAYRTAAHGRTMAGRNGGQRCTGNHTW